MNDETLVAVPEEITREDKVRGVLFKNLSSSLMFAICIIYTVAFAITVIGSIFFGTFSPFSFVSYVFPILITVGYWKTYNNAKIGTTIDTSGLAILKGVLTFYFVLLIIVSGLVGLVSLLSMLFNPLTIIVLLPLIAILVSIALAYYFMKNVVSSTIVGFQIGHVDLKYHDVSAIFLFIAAGLGILSLFLTYGIDWLEVINNMPLDQLPTATYNQLVESIKNITNSSNNISKIVSDCLSIVMNINLGLLVRKMKKDLLILNY